MKWIRVASRISADSNVRQLARDVGSDVYTIVGHLVALWGTMTDEARDGDLSHVHDDDLEAWAEWTGRGHKRGVFARSFRAVLCDGRGVVRAWERYQGAALREHEADRKRKTPKALQDASPAEPPNNSGGIPAESPRTSGGIPPLRDETSTSTRREQRDRRSAEISPPSRGEETGARGAPEPPAGRALALMRPGQPAQPSSAPETPTDEPALATEHDVRDVPGVGVLPAEPVVPAVRAPARVRPRTHPEVVQAVERWVGECREDQGRRRRTEDTRRDRALVVFAYWQTTWDKRRSLYDESRERVLVKRLTENGGDVSELFYAIDGAKRDPYARDQRQGDLTFLLGSRSRVEEYAGKCAGYGREEPHPRAESLARALGVAAASDPSAPLEVASA